MQRAALIFSTVALAGCSTFFVPAYDHAIDSKLDAAVTDIQKLKVALRLHPDPDGHSYAQFEDRYVSILGNLEAADVIVEGQTSVYSGRPAASAAALMKDLIHTCEQTAQGVQGQHKATGMTESLLATTRVDQTCTLALKGEQNLK